VVAIWIRSTVDWADEQAFLAQAPPGLLPKVELWNATFTLPFHVFRGRAHRIAELNRSRVADAAVATWDAIPDGTLVLPVDDDDWFAPDAAQVAARERRPGTDGCYWPSRWVEVPIHAGHRFHLLRRRLLPFTPPRYVLTTNNYAMVKSAGARPLLESHVKASRWLAGGGRLARVERSLSIANRTLGSQTTLHLRRPLGRDELLRKYRRYRRLYHSPPRYAPWAAPYVAAMAELMQELELR
jgi:hypothetical protein